MFALYLTLEIVVILAVAANGYLLKNPSSRFARPAQTRYYRHGVNAGSFFAALILLRLVTHKY